MRINSPLRKCGVLFFGLGCVLLAGCSSVPKKEFGSYREAFKSAHEQSHTVLADYAAVRQQERQLASIAPPGSPAQAQTLETALKLPPYSGNPPQPAEDLVQIRLRAWDVLASYNEALAAVAAGTKPEQAQQAVDGFVGALKNFPFDKVANLGAKATPYTAVAAEVIQWVQKEALARKFKRAVLVADPEMRKFHAAARADAALFHDARMAQLREEYNRAIADLLNLRSRFLQIVNARSWPSNNDINLQIGKINALASISDDLVIFQPISPVTAPSDGVAAKPAGGETELRLAQGFAAQAADKVEPIREILRRAKAYRDLMDQYALLLAEFELSQHRLVNAVEKNSNQLPSLDQIHAVLANFRLAREIYTSTK